VNRRRCTEVILPVARAARSVPPAGCVNRRRCTEVILPVARAARSVPPAGFEPAHRAPEARALSPELRGLPCRHQPKSSDSLR
jgi:hypothetical protein